MKFSVIFICITIGLIGYVNGNCAKCCNTPNYHSLHGPLKVFYEGEKCDCGRTIPVHVEQLRVQPSRQLKQHDYNIEVVTAPKEPTYGSFDFHREVLKVDPEKRLKSYNYDAYSPPEPPADPALSSYQYIVESVKPAAERQPAVLYGHVDRLVVPSEDCGEPKESPKPVVHGCGACGNCPCNCNSRTQTKKVESSGRLSDIFSLNLKKDNLDVIRYDKNNNKGSVKKKRSLFNLKKTLNNKIYRSADDDTLLQLSFLSKQPNLKQPVDDCGKYHYKSCGHRGPKCPECFNCTCVPIKDSHKSALSDDELVSAALDPNFVIPDKYDPIMRQEVSIEPMQYTDQSLADYQRLTNVLQQTRMDPYQTGDLLSPPPARQTQDMIKLLIDLMENKQDVMAYQREETFHNPHDWMYVVDTDNLAYKVGQHQFLDILPLNQLEQEHRVKFIDDRPRNNEIQLPARTPPNMLYGKIDNLADMYKNFQRISPVPIQQLIAPVNQFLDVQAQTQVDHEKRLREFQRLLRINRDTSKNKENVETDHHPKEIFNDELYRGKLKELYQNYLHILRRLEKAEKASQRKSEPFVKKNQKDNEDFSAAYKKALERKSESIFKKYQRDNEGFNEEYKKASEPEIKPILMKIQTDNESYNEKKEQNQPEFVVLKDSGILLGDESVQEEENKSESGEKPDVNEEFVS